MRKSKYLARAETDWYVKENAERQSIGTTLSLDESIKFETDEELEAFVKKYRFALNNMADQFEVRELLEVDVPGNQHSLTPKFCIVF